jgi:hypothetical protein
MNERVHDAGVGIAVNHRTHRTGIRKIARTGMGNPRIGNRPPGQLLAMRIEQEGARQPTVPRHIREFRDHQINLDLVAGEQLPIALDTVGDGACVEREAALLLDHILMGNTDRVAERVLDLGGEHRVHAEIESHRGEHLPPGWPAVTAMTLKTR